MGVKRSKTAFVAAGKRGPRVIRAGQLVSDSDPVVKGREALFEDAEEYVNRPANRVESADSVPGEKRSVATARPSRAGFGAATKRGPGRPPKKKDEGGEK